MCCFVIHCLVGGVIVLPRVGFIFYLKKIGYHFIFHNNKFSWNILQILEGYTRNEKLETWFQRLQNGWKFWKLKLQWYIPKSLYICILVFYNACGCDGFICIIMINYKIHFLFFGDNKTSNKTKLYFFFFFF